MILYDYENQAWTIDGEYVACGHPPQMNCDCYGRLHEGEICQPIADCITGKITREELAINHNIQ